MSDAASPHGLRVEKRGGYHREQVHEYLARLTADRDARWRSVAELEERVREAEGRIGALHHQGEELVPRYDVLGTRAQRILALVEEQASALREEGEQEAEALDARVRGEGEAALGRAEEEMAAYRRAADEQADGIVGLARREADGILEGAAERARTARDEAKAEYEAARKETARIVAEFEENLGRRRDAQEAAEKKAGAELDAHLSGLMKRAEDVLARATADREAAEEEARRSEASSAEVAERLGSESRGRVESIRSRSERDQREHQRRAEAINSHLDHIKQMLATLTGAGAASAAVAAAEEPAPAPKQEDKTVSLERRGPVDPRTTY